MSGFDDTGEVSSMFDMIKRCVYEIHDGENIYNKVDMFFQLSLCKELINFNVKGLLKTLNIQDLKFCIISS